MTALVVPASLRGSVASVHGDSTRSPAGEVAMTWLPRCHSQLVVHVTPGGAVKANVAGPSGLAKYKRIVPGPFYIQLILQPDAARSVLGVPVHELSDRVVDLEDVWGRDAQEVIERVGALRGDPQAAVSAIEAFVASRAGATRGASLARRATEAIATRDVPVQQLADHLGASERTLRQAFLDHVGVSPKRYMRIARVLRVVADPRPASWARLAAEHGFADQAHLNAEFRALLRVSPGQYRAGELPFVRGA